jgi:thioredoxin reductase (NADPH)
VREAEQRPHCLIVGGGPAGLTAAIYLARFNLSVTVIDGGRSRASMIPCTRNHAGYPDGIAGAELIARMRAQAVHFGVSLITGDAEALTRSGDGFRVSYGSSDMKADAVLLATGVVNNRPTMCDDVHDAALARGLVRYCPICDGYEVRDRRIAVLGMGERGAREALFLRSYSSDITLISPDRPHERFDRGDELAAAGIRLIDGPCSDIRIADADDTIHLILPQGALAFDTLYPALGSVIRSELAASLGAKRTDEGCLIVDSHQRTSVPGLYAAGDVVLGLDQISHAMGEGGVAATTMRNDLAQRMSLWAPRHSIENTADRLTAAAR